jgi:AcrR family transcriptional regulator
LRAKLLDVDAGILERWIRRETPAKFDRILRLPEVGSEGIRDRPIRNNAAIEQTSPTTNPLTNSVRDDYNSSMSVRNPFEAPEVRSRRGGPVKEPLNRDAIVAEALHQISTCGLNGMSLRKVATALDTGPASLYAYIEDLSELHTLVLDRALEKVSLRGAKDTGWRERLEGVLESYARVLAASPGLAQLAFGTVATGPNALRIMEKLMALLEEGGVDLPTGAWAVDLLVLYVTAIVAERGNGLLPMAPEGSIARVVRTLSEQEHPRLHAARAELLSGTPKQRFRWALEVLLQGILRSRRLPPTRRASALTKRRARMKRPQVGPAR